MREHRYWMRLQREEHIGEGGDGFIQAAIGEQLFRGTAWVDGGGRRTGCARSEFRWSMVP